jgi:predicted cupin superfamily sugar epimerase
MPKYISGQGSSYPERQNVAAPQEGRSSTTREAICEADSKKLRYRTEAARYSLSKKETEMNLVRMCMIGCFAGWLAITCEAVDVKTVIEKLSLVPMVDEACSGYYRETFRSDLKASVEKDRQAASLIYYLLTVDRREDPWHRIASDEILLYHAGAPMRIVLLYTDGSWKEFTLGNRFDEGHVAQVVIPANTWMGFVMAEDKQFDWGLYGVMVVPGWALADIDFATGEKVAPLRKKYPEAFKLVDENDWPVLKGAN